MWAAWVVAAIALAAATFMLRFLIALLREGAPTVCYWIVPVPGRPEKECHIVLSSIYADEDCCASEDRRSDYYELLENENHVQDKSDSSLVALDVPRVSDRLGWRSIHSRRDYISREHRL
ncbi:MAG TPA: hypothetical protein VNX26_16045 [Candidatus Acidoferrum sp.]|jgi:hypothetical protein|nr:hypothetical protein [Candidatus Acidoferrum sp.]